MYYLYIFCVSNAAKIGITSDVDRRRREIQAHNPHKIHVACTFTFPDQESAYKVEQSLHKYYDERHIHYEWYRVDPMQVIALVDMIKVFHAATDVDVKITPQAKERIKEIVVRTSNAVERAIQWYTTNPDKLDVPVRALVDEIGVSKDSINKARAIIRNRQGE